MITLKHLAREFNDADPYKLRTLLRAKFGKRRRWRWDPSTEQQQLKEVREYLKTAIDTPSKVP